MAPVLSYAQPMTIGLAFDDVVRAAAVAASATTANATTARMSPAREPSLFMLTPSLDLGGPSTRPLDADPLMGFDI